ncbi:MAG: hypothetical protein AAGK77_08760 [Pseudomonadota bacterium]
MIVGHLAAGSLAALSAVPAFKGLIFGSVLPDVETLWFFGGWLASASPQLADTPTINLGGFNHFGFGDQGILLIGLGLGGLLHLAQHNTTGTVASTWP